MPRTAFLNIFLLIHLNLQNIKGGKTMKTTTLAIIIMAFGAIICSFISNRLGFGNSGKSRIFSARTFNALSIICIMGVTGLMFWKYMNFYTIPRSILWSNIDFCAVPHLLLLITICSYIKNKKRKRLCIPFWKKLHVTLLAYIIFGGAGFAMEIIWRATNGNYTNEHITLLFIMVIPIMIILIIITNIMFGCLLTRRRVSSYYY